MLRLIISLITYTLVTAIELTKTKNDTSELLLVHVLFSNGKTTPPTYPGDPYEHYPTFPLAVGDLTDEGQLTSYKIGQHLRMRYDSMLGDVFQTNLSASFTSNRQYTEASLQCVLSGLFPPEGIQKFAFDLHWQPVNYKILNGKNDKYLSAHHYCNKSDWGLSHDPTYKELYEYLTSHTGHSVTSNEQVNQIYQTINFQKENNITIPVWAEPIVLEDMKRASMNFHKQLVQQRTKIAVGNLLQFISDSSVKKVKGILEPPNRKMFLFSGEKSNIMLMLAALQNLNFSIPNSSAYLIFELHKLNEQIGFKIFYRDAIAIPERSDDVLLQYQHVNGYNCGELCLLDNFIAETRKWYEPKPTCY